MGRTVKLALLATALALGCAAVAPTWRYRTEGTPGDGATPVYLAPLASGRAEYRVESATLTDPEASFVRVVRAVGDAPVRVDLGRVRLRLPGGVEVPIVRVCLLETSAPRCVDGGAARGQVRILEPGEAVRLRVDFGPLDPLAPGGAGPNPALARLTLVEDGVLVGGRPAPVSVTLEQLPRP
jgi:hypothetical protein